MRNEQTLPSVTGLDITKVLAELEVPFAPCQVQWRVTNTSNDKKRGQVIPYADPRAYTDRLNALFSPQGWTREYKVHDQHYSREEGREHPLGQGAGHLHGHNHWPVVSLRNG